jgi:hypothetical protein
MPWPVTVKVCAASLTFTSVIVWPWVTFTVDGENVKPLSGPSRTVVAMMPPPPYPLPPLAPLEPVLVPLPLPELLPPPSLAVAAFPHAAPTNASTTNPSASPRRVRSRCIS